MLRNQGGHGFAHGGRLYVDSRVLADILPQRCRNVNLAHRYKHKGCARRCEDSNMSWGRSDCERACDVTIAVPGRSFLMHRMSARVSFVLLLLMAAPRIFAQEMTPAQKEVWQMEEAYWNDVKASNSDHYATLSHYSFLGWPRDRDRPLGKKDLTEGAAKKMAAGRVVSCEFLSKAVTVVGDVGVTQYSVKATIARKDGTNETYTSRVTHTWLKTGSTWEI